MQKRILVSDGGGQMGVFMWAVLVELYRLGLRFFHFHEYFATSAGIFNSAYFLTEQLQEGMRIWTKHLPKGFWKWFSNDMLYLERILTEIEPLFCNLLREREQKIFATLCNARTLKPETICLNTSPDPIGVMLASAAMPYLTGPRKLGKDWYYDAGLVAQPPISQVSFEDIPEVLVLLTTPPGYRESNYAWQMVGTCSFHDPVVSKLMLGYATARNNALQATETNPNLKIIQPLEPLPINWRSKDPEAIARTVRLGTEAAQRFAKDQKW